MQFGAGIARTEFRPGSVPKRRPEVHGDDRLGHGCVEEKRLEAGDGGYHGAGEGGVVSDGCEIAELGTQASGKKAHAAGLKLHQSYVRVGPKRLFKVNRYAHARQMKRMKGEVKKLRTILGRVARDVERKIDQIANPCVQQLAESHLESELELAKRVMTQERTSKNKVYSAHAPEVECISKGKVHKRYEFGVKVGIAVTNRSNFVLSGLAFPGNPYDGHTLST